MAPQFMMTWWVMLDDVVERPRYRGVMCWMMGVSSAMSLWVVLDDLVEHSRCRSGSCWMRAGGNAGTVVCNSAFLHTARPKTAAPCAIPRFYTPRDPKTSFGVQFHVFAHRKAQNRRSVCNSTFFYTPQDPKTSFGVQFRLFAHRKAGRPTAIGHPAGLPQARNAVFNGFQPLHRRRTPFPHVCKIQKRFSEANLSRK